MKTMKKYLFMAVAAIAALSGCSSDDDFEQNQAGKQALVFTATMENSEGSRATFDSGNKCAAWEAGDQISINGKTYSAQAAGTTTTFKADGEDATGDTYKAYFPADLYNGTTATLPATQTYEAGEFNMPMYAESTTTELAFKNLCAVLAIKVTSADIAMLKSIKVTADKKLNGSFTVYSNKAVMGEDGTNTVVLSCSTALTLTSGGTVFYIAIPAQEYKYLNIFLSADGTTYTQAMATKKVAGLGSIARNTIFNIDYAKNATKLWAGNILIADCNVGATSPEGNGGHYNWGMSKVQTTANSNEYVTGKSSLSGDTDTATKLWGDNWRMPTRTELQTLSGLGSLTSGAKGIGLRCTSTTYPGNSVYLPGAGYVNGGKYNSEGYGGYYWSSSPNGSSSAINMYFNQGGLYMGYDNSRNFGCSVRAVLVE